MSCLQVYTYTVLLKSYSKSSIKRHHMERVWSNKIHGHGPSIEPAMTRVSRDVRMESLPVFYTTRRFSLCYRYTAYHHLNSSWVHNIQARQWADIQSFHLNVKLFRSAGCDCAEGCSGGFIHIDFSKKHNSYDLTFITKCGGVAVPSIQKSTPFELHLLGLDLQPLLPMFNKL
jgi:hypothetical protein